jgi:Ca2+-binding EF-hand superfamily protein
MKKFLLITALVALSPAVLVAGDTGSPTGGGPGHGEEMFKRHDTNNDGVVSREEAQAAGAERISRKFDKMDTNKDGQLTQEEMRQAREQRRAGMKMRFDEHFKSADKDSDGSISKSEAEQGMPMLAKHFDAVDTDKDGQASRDELKAHHANMRHGRHD